LLIIGLTNFLRNYNKQAEYKNFLQKTERKTTKKKAKKHFKSEPQVEDFQPNFLENKGMKIQTKRLIIDEKKLESQFEELLQKTRDLIIENN